MLDYSTLRDEFKAADRINSRNLVIAEWNMNRYRVIEQYGLYATNAPHGSIYNKNDPRIVNGKNFILYDDGTKEVPPDQEYFSELSSIFKPNRPDPGIILLQQNNKMIISPDIGNLKTQRINPVNPRFYPFSKFRPYDYFNTSKNIIEAPAESGTGVTWTFNKYQKFNPDTPANLIPEDFPDTNLESLLIITLPYQDNIDFISAGDEEGNGNRVFFNIPTGSPLSTLNGSTRLVVARIENSLPNGTKTVDLYVRIDPAQYSAISSSVGSSVDVSGHTVKLSSRIVSGVSNPTSGIISGSSPFVVYDEEFPCNKIKIKVQNHQSVPDRFSIEILQGPSLQTASWVTAYSVNQSSSADFSTGVLDVYYNNGNWNKVSVGAPISNFLVNDINELSNVNSTELTRIRGVRLSVEKMSIINVNNRRYPASLEIIELSPRLEVDMTEYTESFNIESSLGDSTSFGLPVGGLVTSNGSISLSNEGNEFLFSSILSQLKLISPDVSFKFFQFVTPPNSSPQAIPIKVMYSTEWSIGGDYSVEVGLEDGFKFLKETAAPDLLFVSEEGTRLSTAVMFTLDNVGFSGLEFKKSENGRDSEDVFIRNFFCKREQTVAEVFEEIAIGTQCSMYFDAVGRLNVLTKERLTQSVASTPSGSVTPGTDFWMVFDENYKLENNQNVAEFNQIQDYHANVINYSEGRVDPITDGEVVYHIYGPRKVPRLDEMPRFIRNKVFEDTAFPQGLAFSNFGYTTKILWEPGDDNQSVLGASNVRRDIDRRRLKNVFKNNVLAFNEDDAVRTLYRNSGQKNKDSMVIHLDVNEGLTFADYSGYVLINSEYIKYNGKLYDVHVPRAENPLSGRFIFFTQEELWQTVRDIPPNSSIQFVGLVIDMEFIIQSQVGEKYNYRVVGDGRGKFGSKIRNHKGFSDATSGLGQKFKLRMGAPSNNTIGGNLSSTTQFDFLQRSRFRSVKRSLERNNLFEKFNANFFKSYLGFLKIQGMNGTYDSGDRKAIDAFYSASAGGNVAEAARLLEEINKQTDKDVPGNFDDYVFLSGERNIYGQKIDLPFSPDVISTRMRLYSPRKKVRGNLNVMSTLSSIAGIGFNINDKGEGYYLEVEGLGSGKGGVAEESYKNNLRFYKVTLNKNGKYQPKLLFVGPVNAYTVSNVDVQVIKAEQTADPVFELSVRIERGRGGSRFTVWYGETKIASYTEAASSVTNRNINNVCVFVRGDSQAIYEYVSAATKKDGATRFNRRLEKVDQEVKAGVLPVSQQKLYQNPTLKLYFNDFANLARQVREYDIRFEYPAFTSALIDVSKVNNNYFVKEYNSTGFGGRLVVANSSSGPIIISANSGDNAPLYIVGIELEELTTGTITMEDFYNKTDEKKRKVTQRENNRSVYGEQTFVLDSQFMQSISQAERMMRWIKRYCTRQRLQLDMEIFANPLLELGDKIKVYDKTRGYNQDNEFFGDKTFVVNTISYSNDGSGPSMSVQLVEVGEE